MLAAGLPLVVAPSSAIGASAPRAVGTQAPCLRHCPPPSPSPCFVVFDVVCLDSPSPEIVVISPVPLDPAPPPGTPSYLIGTLTSPSPSPPADTGGSPVPLGGGFNDLPTPNPAAATSSSGNSGGGGLPLPLLLAGFLILAGAAGAVLYAVAPGGDRFPEKIPGAPLGLRPYRADGSELNLIDSPVGPPPRPRRPRSRA
jgi:hypothetical protein